MKVTIVFAEGTSNFDSMNRAMGCVLLEKEAKTVEVVFSGFSFSTDRAPTEVLGDFYADGFDNEDFASVEFEFNH